MGIGITAKLTVLVAAFAISLGGGEEEWILAWEDNFDGGNLRDRWEFDVGCQDWEPGQLQCYMDNRWDNVRQEDGLLTIQAIKENSGQGDCHNPAKNFTSTRIHTRESWLHGKFEMRARLPKGKHLSAGFFLLPALNEYGPWPRSGEMNVMRGWGSVGPLEGSINSLIKFGPSPEEKGEAGAQTGFGVDLSQDFHTYGFEWNSGKISWMLDDQIWHRESLVRYFWPGLYNGTGQPFDKEFFIVVGLAVSGEMFRLDPFDPIEAELWPKPTFEVDWVRKWEWSGN